mmetsp:Transcript_18146/g.32730  ORF Transcript_18146/g.32730 Transcript_18146/m.32730 type:complete len:113 (-) Transcript_18146:165-503(-)
MIILSANDYQSKWKRTSVTRPTKAFLDMTAGQHINISMTTDDMSVASSDIKSTVSVKKRMGIFITPVQTMSVEQKSTARRSRQEESRRQQQHRRRQRGGKFRQWFTTKNDCC